MKVDKKYLIILASILVIGFLSGVVGELWVNSFLLPDPYLSFKSYSDLSKKIDDLISGQSGRKNLSDEDAAMAASVSRIKPSIVGIYRYKSFYANSLTSLGSGDFLGQGAVITSDGWIMTADAVAKSEKAALYAATANHKIFKVEKIIISQPTGAAFLKISAADLPVAEFNLKSGLSDGQSVFAFSGKSGARRANIADLNYSKPDAVSGLVRSSEVFYKYILLSSKAEPDMLGSPVVATSGRMIGIIRDESGAVLPMDDCVLLMKGAVKGQAWKQPYLGVKFYDYSEILNPLIADAKGALILKARGLSADSQTKGILQADDIILKVENEELDSNKNLPELLSAYESGETVKFLIKRAGKEQEVNIKL